MHYWNRDNFVGLLELARELANTHALRVLAEYCVLREKGLRTQALARLDEFLTEAALWDIDMRRRNVLTVLQASARITQPTILASRCFSLQLRRHAHRFPLPGNGSLLHLTLSRLPICPLKPTNTSR